MNEQEVISLLTSCKLFAMRLAQAGYDYVFDPADLFYIPIHEQVKGYLSAHESEEDFLQRLDAQSGLTNQEVRWLIAFYVMREVLQQQLTHPSPTPYYPFRERLTRVEQSWQADQAFGYVGSWDDLDLHVLVELAGSDPLTLFAVEKRLARMHADPEGNPLPEYTPLELMVLTTFYQQAQADGPLSLLPPDTRAPSETTNTPWLLVMKKPGHYPDYEKAGKWIIFFTRQEVDAFWKQIAGATRAGQLGPLSKVSTAQPRKHSYKHEHVIQVYTDDSEDQADISRVREALWTLGINQHLSYGRVRRPSGKNVPF